ncbi:hypothetical protein [Azohydromonas sediminis]|uniref:hypothetical protein n=1 Tax=Azohydromonas sediminis TaxID=2259674 RepID=UPI0013C3555A|nr:hypothetical protein [Azohydromonas sediminis]
MRVPDFWRIDGDLCAALDFASSLPRAEGLGFVYVLALSNGNCKLGSTTDLAKRLVQHRTETARYGVSIRRCLATRPHFNYRAVESGALWWLGSEGRREVLPKDLSTVRRAVEAQRPEWTAPQDYVPRHRSAWALCNALMQSIAAGLGIASQGELTREASRILDAHVELGRRTGLSETEGMLNALAVIEARTGIDLRPLRAALLEVQ